jgi:hypothetical protein
VRSALQLVEARLEAGEQGEALLALVAGTKVEIPEDELRLACRRAMLVLAAGGDPHREVGLDSPAVLVLARELDTAERRRALADGLRVLQESVAGFSLTSALLPRLVEEPDLAWRAFALAVLADELGDE